MKPQTWSRNVVFPDKISLTFGNFPDSCQIPRHSEVFPMSGHPVHRRHSQHHRIVRCSLSSSRRWFRYWDSREGKSVMMPEAPYFIARAYSSSSLSTHKYVLTQQMNMLTYTTTISNIVVTNIFYSLSLVMNHLLQHQYMETMCAVSLYSWNSAMLLEFLVSPMHLGPSKKGSRMTVSRDCATINKN